MQQSQFVHLHNHTEYSLLDGACKIFDGKKPGELFKTIADRYKMRSLAITDHGNMFGAVEFYSACLESAIKPIIGCEVYFAKGSRHNKDARSNPVNYHLTLLAQSNAGYRNLMKLVTIGYLEGFYRKPRIDFEVLSKYSSGLVCLSGCMQGEIPQAILEGKTAEAEELSGKYLELFGKEKFYFEIMDNGMKEQKIVADRLIQMSRRMGVGLVATNDCHYLNKEDARIHDILLCVDTGTTLDDPKRLKFSTDEFYYRSPDEMLNLFKDIPEATKNTLKIADMCAVELPRGEFFLPEYTGVPDGMTPIQYLEKLCEEGLKKRYGKPTQEHQERLKKELSIIDRMNFAEYFLIVRDFVEYARSIGVPVGYGRGSGAGSIVAYTLNITNICPIKYGLLFERFLNPDRRTMPDLDIDFADVGRDKVIDYVRQKYGADRVAQIITYSAMQSRSAIKDVARAMGFTATDSAKLASLIPLGPSATSTIYDALREVPELKKIYDSDQRVKECLDAAMRIEGLKRHVGVHAAGIVIAKDDITNYTPMAISKRDNSTVTQYDGESLVELGLLKIDILGIKTLSVVEECKKLIEIRHGKKITTPPPDDPATYKLFSQARTLGVFQLESSGMRDLLRKLKPTGLEDIIALISLYRPGPMGTGMIDDFVARKHKKVKISYEHPLLEPILSDTYGVILYQEHVMKISQTLAGFTPGQADILRRAMGKKKPEEIAKLEGDFISGCRKNGIDPKIAKKIFDQIKHFGGYGFNKSHAAAYAMLAYETAYFKANYTLEFMTSLINSEIGRSTKKEEDNKIVQYLKEAENYGIKVLPPDINKSMPLFTVEGKSIRYGLLAIKNVGEAAARHIEKTRSEKGPYKNAYDFVLKTFGRELNRKAIESLVKSGAFDQFADTAGYARAEFLSNLDDMINYVGKMNSAGGSEMLFGIEETEPEFKAEFKAFSEHDCLKQEKEVLGAYLSGHPLARLGEELQKYSNCQIVNLLSENPPQGLVKVSGLVESLKKMVSKGTKQVYVRFMLEDISGDIEVVVFPKNYKNGIGDKLTSGETVVVEGRLNTSRESREFIAEKIMTLEEARRNSPVRYEKMTVKLLTAGLEEDVLKHLRKTLLSYPGDTRVEIEAGDPSGGFYLIETDMSVKVSPHLLEAVKKIAGPDNVFLTKV